MSKLPEAPEIVPLIVFVPVVPVPSAAVSAKIFLYFSVVRFNKHCYILQIACVCEVSSITEPSVSLHVTELITGSIESIISF